MSLEKAMAILDAAAVKNPLVPIPAAAQPEVITKVDNAAVVQDIKFDLKTDSLKPEEAPKEEKKEPEKVEEKPEEKPEEEEKMSKRFAMLAKKEKALFAQDQKNKADRAEIELKLKKIEEFETLKAKVRDNPTHALDVLGTNYDDLTKFQLTGKMPNGPDQKIEHLSKLIEQMRADSASREAKALEDAELSKKARAEETASAFQGKIRDYTKSNSDKYELICLNEANHLVFNKIAKHFDDTQRLLSIEEGSDLVEKELEVLAEKNARSKKLLARLTPQPQGGDKKQPTQAQPRTLNNNMTSSAPSLLPPATERERMERALAALSR
jgi:hypothetical protein